ncbi:MAG: hypothetical protein ABI556_09030 [Gemmatimonadales bacterium]
MRIFGKRIAAIALLLAGCSGTSAPDTDNPTDPPVEPGQSLTGRRMFPADNLWNRDVSAEPVDPSSDALIATCGAPAALHPDFGTTWEGSPIGIPYVVVRGTQPRVPVSFDYAGESDPGPYPVPPDAPIEGGSASNGDRHVLVVDSDNWKLYELYDARPLDGGTRWSAASGAVFDLSSNTVRPAGWTSADAAGLPILPGLVRYDEVVEQKEIRHALRFTCPTTRKAYVAPARHFASSRTQSDQPPMGMRVRLKSSVDLTSFPASAQVILKALQKYGMFLADNGSSFYITGTHDMRWNDEELNSLKRLHGRDFEVVKMGTLVTQ